LQRNKLNDFCICLDVLNRFVVALDIFWWTK